MRPVCHYLRMRSDDVTCETLIIQLSARESHVMRDEDGWLRETDTWTFPLSDSVKKADSNWQPSSLVVLGRKIESIICTCIVMQKEVEDRGGDKQTNKWVNRKERKRLSDWGEIISFLPFSLSFWHFYFPLTGLRTPSLSLRAAEGYDYSRWWGSGGLCLVQSV